MSGRYVQYGCGLSCPVTWENYDASPSLRLQRMPLIGGMFKRPPLPPFPPNARYGDIVRGLPVPDASCQGLYCSHVLEHLSLDDLRVALRNSLRLLARGGRFRLVVPDLEYCVERYRQNPDASAAIELLRDTRLGRESRSRSLGGMLRHALGASNHLWMWDYKALARELADTGFIEVRRAAFNDSVDRRYVEVEDAGRWQNCLGVEARRG